MSNKKDLEIVCNIKWKNKPPGGSDAANIIGLCDIPATTLRFEQFKSYLLKNSGTSGDNIRIFFKDLDDKEVPINTQIDFQIALYTFRRKARQNEIIDITLERMSDESLKSPSRTSDAETQSDIKQADTAISMGSEAESLNSYKDMMEGLKKVGFPSDEVTPPDWFSIYMPKFKAELVDEILSAVTILLSDAQGAGSMKSKIQKDLTKYKQATQPKRPDVPKFEKLLTKKYDEVVQKANRLEKECVEQLRRRKRLALKRQCSSRPKGVVFSDMGVAEGLDKLALTPQMMPTKEEYIAGLKLKWALADSLDKANTSKDTSDDEETKKAKQAIDKKAKESSKQGAKSKVVACKKPLDLAEAAKIAHEKACKSDSSKALIDVVLPKQPDTLSEYVELQLNAAPVETNTLRKHYLSNETFVHKWEVLNNGEVPWPKGTKLNFSWGCKEFMPEEKSVKCPTLFPGEKDFISVTLQAPACPGPYECYWHFTYKGMRFGHWLCCQIIVDEDLVSLSNSTREERQGLIRACEASSKARIEEMDKKVMHKLKARVEGCLPLPIQIPAATATRLNVVHDVGNLIDNMVKDESKIDSMQPSEIEEIDRISQDYRCLLEVMKKTSPYFDETTEEEAAAVEKKSAKKLKKVSSRGAASVLQQPERWPFDTKLERNGCTEWVKLEQEKIKISSKTHGKTKRSSLSNKTPAPVKVGPKVKVCGDAQKKEPEVKVEVAPVEAASRRDVEEDHLQENTQGIVKETVQPEGEKLEVKEEKQEEEANKEEVTSEDEEFIHVPKCFKFTNSPATCVVKVPKEVASDSEDSFIDVEYISSDELSNNYVVFGPSEENEEKSCNCESAYPGPGAELYRCPCRTGAVRVYDKHLKEYIIINPDGELGHTFAEEKDQPSQANSRTESEAREAAPEPEQETAEAETRNEPLEPESHTPEAEEIKSEPTAPPEVPPVASHIPSQPIRIVKPSYSFSEAIDLSFKNPPQCSPQLNIPAPHPQWYSAQGLTTSGSDVAANVLDSATKAPSMTASAWESLYGASLCGENRYFVFPQDCPGYEVVNVGSGFGSPAPGDVQHFQNVRPCSSPYQCFGTPPIRQSYSSTPSEAFGIPPQQHQPQQPQPQPQQHMYESYHDAMSNASYGSPQRPAQPVHILPQTLVTGAVNVASSAINTARSVISMIVNPESPGTWINGHWISSNPETPRERNLRLLAEMGFQNRDLNATLLARYNDDMQRTVAELLS